MLVYDDSENVEKVKIFDHGVDFKEPEDYGEFQLSYRTGDVVAPKISGTEPLWLEAEHFVHCVRSGEPPLTDGWAGLRVVASLEPRRRRSTPAAASSPRRPPTRSPAPPAPTSAPPTSDARPRPHDS